MKAQEAVDLIRKIRKEGKRFSGFDIIFMDDIEDVGLDYPELNLTKDQEKRLLGIQEKVTR